MCLQCRTDAWNYGTVVPGWSLMKADKPHPQWSKWGLVQSNDPTMVWNEDPIKDPTYYFSEEEDNEIGEDSPLWDECFKSLDQGENFTKIELDAMSGFELVTACIAAGYSKDEHGSVYYWLWQKMAELIERNPSPRRHYEEELPAKVRLK